MNLQQMRCLAELARQGFGVSATARALSVSQPAVTKQLRQIEGELGAPLVVRNRNRLEGATPFGREIIALAQEVCVSVDAIQRLAREATGDERSEIRIAATHAQAKFVLPGPLQAFSQRHRNAVFEIKEAAPEHIVSLVASGKVDVGVTPASGADDGGVAFHVYRAYPLLALAPKHHPLSRKRKVSLATLASYPIIATGAGQVGRMEVVGAFKAGGVEPKILLGAPNFDVVKACVEQGLGLAILPSYTYDEARDGRIRVVRLSHAFPATVTSVVVRRNLHAPRLVHEFLRLLMPAWRVPITAIR